LIRHRARTSNNDSPRAKSAKAQIFSRIEISRGFRASSWLFFRLVQSGARGWTRVYKKKTNPGPGAARAFVADRSSFAICTTTQHSNHSNRSNRSNTTQHSTQIVFSPAFLTRDRLPPPDPKRKSFRASFPRRRPTNVGRTSRRVASVFPTALYRVTRGTL